MVKIAIIFPICAMSLLIECNHSIHFEIGTGVPIAAIGDRYVAVALHRHLEGECMCHTMQ